MVIIFFSIIIVILFSILLWGGLTKWKFISTAQNFKIKNSSIHGDGVFATKNFNKNEQVFSTIIDENKFSKNNESFKFDFPLNMVNHCWKGNTKLKKIGKKMWGLFSTKKIMKGEEIVANYNKQPYFIKEAGENWTC